MLSIIIPTLNEENYLPLLLESIKKQELKDYEIIVADADSQDKTVKIAEEYDCKVTAGGLPAKGRNNGAKLAKGSLFFFLDADVYLPEEFFKKTLLEFKERNLSAAGFWLTPREKGIFSLFFNVFYNIPAFITEKILPHAAIGIFVKKNVFEKAGGFDETIKLAEDHDLVRRIKKTGEKFGILKSSRIFVSSRRFKKDGWLKTYIKYIFCELYMIFIGPVRSDIFKYRFNHYCKKKNN